MEIKFKENTTDIVRTIDRAGLMAGSFKDISMRTKEDLVDIFGQEEGSYEYAPGVVQDSMAEGSSYAIRGGASLIQRKETKVPDILPGSEPDAEDVQRSGAEYGKKSILSRQSRARMMDEEVLQNAEEYRSDGRIKWGKAFRNDELIQRNAAKTATNRFESPKTAELIQRQRKEYVINRLRNGSNGSSFIRSSVVRNSRFGEKVAVHTGRIVKGIAGSAKTLFGSLTAGSAVAVLVIVLMTLFGAALTITDDGNRIVGIGDDAIVEVARAELGNKGGEKYWKWYGFSSRVDWCAIFCSWCADQCGYIESGTLPKFSVVGDGANWFKGRHRWAGRGYSPRPGDFIFFDYEQDGVLDHVGIVENCDGKVVTTIEGNSGDACKRNSYIVGSGSIAGYGLSVSMTSVTFEKSSTWAKKIADDNSYHYVTFSSDPKTQECPVCNNHSEGRYRGWNCIGFAFACWRHGAGIPSNCSCSVINDGQWNQLLNCKTDADADRLATRLVGVPCNVIRNDGDAIPIGKLKQGDIIALFNNSGYYHTMFYEGGGKAADCTSGRSDNIQSGNPLSQSTKYKIKVAIRYGG